MGIGTQGPYDTPAQQEAARETVAPSPYKKGSWIPEKELGT